MHPAVADPEKRTEDPARKRSVAPRAGAAPEALEAFRQSRRLYHFPAGPAGSARIPRGQLQNAAPKGDSLVYLTYAGSALTF